MSTGEELSPESSGDNDHYRELGIGMDKGNEIQRTADVARVEARLKSFEKFIGDWQNRVASDWNMIWAQRDTFDWNGCAGFTEFGGEPLHPEMLAGSIDAGQRQQLHRLGHSDAWIESHLRNWAEAADVILFENFRKVTEGETLPEGEPTEEQLQQRERDQREFRLRAEEAKREDLQAARERLREQPVSAKARHVLHALDKTDTWIDQNLHNELEVATFLIEELPVIQARNRDLECALTEKAIWLFAEVPESAVASELVEQAKAIAEHLAQVLGLSPIRVRWVEELGPEEAVGTRQLKARRGQWGCNLATLKAEHLVRIPIPALRDPTTGRLQPPFHTMLGSTDPLEPNTVNLLADHRCYDDWKSLGDINVPPAAFSTGAVLDIPFEDIDVILATAWGTTVRNVLAYTTRQLWQLRHFKPEFLVWGNPLKVRDAQVFDTLTTSRSAFARIRGKRWFEECVERYAPLKTGSEPQHELERGAERRDESAA